MRHPYKAWRTACLMTVFLTWRFSCGPCLDMAVVIVTWLLFVIMNKSFAFFHASWVRPPLKGLWHFGHTLNHFLVFTMCLFTTGEVLLPLNWYLPSMDISSRGCLDIALAMTRAFSIALQIMLPVAAEPKTRMRRAILGLIPQWWGTI